MEFLSDQVNELLEHRSPNDQDVERVVPPYASADERAAHTAGQGQPPLWDRLGDDAQSQRFGVSGNDPCWR